MKPTARPLAWLLMGLVLLLGACADLGHVRGAMRYGMPDTPDDRSLLWPAAPEVPRYRFGGTLTGEPNFRDSADSDRTLRSLGRWLVGLGEASDQPQVLQRPSGLTGDGQGRLFVSDTSRQAVFVFDEKAGELLTWEYAQPLTRFVAPSGLVTGEAGRLYVADADLGYVAQLDPRGAPLAVIGRGQLQRPTGLARDPRTGDLYVADTYAHDIKVFDDRGRLLRALGRRGEGPGEFNYPTHMAFAHGSLYVTDTLNSRVQVFDTATGTWSRRFGSRGLLLGDLVRPKGVSVDSEGNVYVVESYHDSLLVFSAAGEFLLPIGGSGPAFGRFYLPAGVWVDERNRVHVADMFNGRVVRFEFLGGG